MKDQKMSKLAGLLSLALVGGTLALMTPMTSSAHAATYYQPGYNNSPSVLLNGQQLNTTVPPIVKNGSTLVPMRDIFEALGATVVWDPQDQSIRARKDTTEIWLQIGNSNAHVGSRQVWLNQPPILSVGSTLVPLRFVSEALGANVEWDNTTRVVRITTDENVGAEEQQAPQNTDNENYNTNEQVPPQNTNNENYNEDEQNAPQYANNEDSDANFQTFYDDLSPYGQWLQDPEYGYVWQPRVDSNFRPYYTGGHWAMTQYGNMWVSDYSWGWAAFHYGRWNLSDDNGWIWIPGNEWAPAWVSWRSGGGYYGWAPLGPSFNINISIGNYHAPNNWYCFVPQGHLYEHSYNHYSYNNYGSTGRHSVSNQTINLIRNTTIIHNTYIHNNNTYITGPRVHEVESVTHQKVQVYNINNSGRAGSSKIQNNSINIFRPAIPNRPNGKNRSQMAPRNVAPLNHSIFSKSKVNEVNGNAANRTKSQTFPTRNDRTNYAPRVNTPRNPAPNPNNNGRNANQDNARRENTPARNERTNTAPRINTPYNPAPNPDNNGRNANQDNTRRENPTVRNDRANTAPRIDTSRNPVPNPNNNGRNANQDNTRRENPTPRNDRTDNAPRINTPYNPAPNLDNNGRNANQDNTRRENPTVRNDRANTAPRIDTSRNPVSSPNNNGRNANQDNARRENPPARNDRTDNAPRVNTPRNPAPNPENNGRNANDNNGRNKNVAPPRNKDNSNQSNDQKHHGNNGQTNNQQ